MWSNVFRNKRSRNIFSLILFIQVEFFLYIQTNTVNLNKIFVNYCRQREMKVGKKCFFFLFFYAPDILNGKIM